ncbi:MAG: hypothetical protein JWP12_220 [Bacteroidetes bacterium]|nr:hypothetical protein [Bacteroidota bacterium]
MFANMQAQVISPFNKLEIKDTGTSYSFIVSGHFHGASTNISSFPASSLQANIDTLNALHPSFLMSLGDLFLDVNDTYLQHYQKSLFDKLKMPLFNSVGNHDLANGNMYEKIFGKEYFYFTVQSELFIVLNTEESNGSIKSEQLEMFQKALSQITEKKIKNVFIFSHRPIWSENSDKYKNLFEGNTRSALSTNFDSDIKPLLKSIPKNVNTFWCSGSMGAAAPASFFYDKDAETNVVFMQTALRDLPRDAALLVNVNNGAVTFNGISFTGQKLDPVETYNMDYWSKTVAPEQQFNYRMLPYLTLLMLHHQYFWIGFGSALILLLIFSIIRKRWKRKK